MFQTKNENADKAEEILKEHGYLPNDEEEGEMENVQLTNDYYNRIKYLEFVAFFFAWIGVGCCIVEYEQKYWIIQREDIIEQRVSKILTMLLIFNLFCTIATSISIIFRYIFNLKWQIMKKILLPMDDLFTTSFYKSMILEVMCVGIAPYPGLENMFITEVYVDRKVTTELNINVALLCAAMLIRLYLFVRFVLSFSRYRNTRMHRLCIINGSKAGFMFSIKAVKNDRPYSFITFSLLIPLVICSYGLRMFERPLMSTSMLNFDSMGNCIWCIIITMATVGYGDYFPISNFGRIIGIMACLWGVFITAIMVVTLNNLLDFTKQQQRSFEILCKLQYKDELRQRAVDVILSASRQKKERQKEDIDPSNLSSAYGNFKKNIFSLRQVSKKVRGMYDEYSQLELVTKQAEQMNQEMQLMMEAQQSIMKEFTEFRKNLQAKKEQHDASALFRFRNSIITSQLNSNSIMDSDSERDITIPGLSQIEKQQLLISDGFLTKR
eukprot:403334408